ncbi:MAG: ATP-binding protein [Synergistaceae bacterium]|jgi:anti-sigma regulatory factor (Ser/Thr protein kinase)|nr:ATP-binding protein [Synergistaceae bacterium]
MASPYLENFVVDENELFSIGEAAAQIKAILKMLGIPSDVIRRASIVAYEAEMNLVIHGGGGRMELEVRPERVKISALDAGPGIPDIEKAMMEGFSTASEKIREMGFGAGMGLPNIKRNSDSLELLSEVGKGTTLRAEILVKQEREG